MDMTIISARLQLMALLKLQQLFPAIITDIYINNNYIGVQNGSIVGNVNQSSAVPVQFANNFILPRRATIHFVARYGNPLTGVTYKGPSILETLYLKKVLHIL